MAISQADFYAFSQATGSPVPEDPEGRAALAPYVMEWRRNQLKAQPEGGNVVDTLGKDCSWSWCSNGSSVGCPSIS
jgi:hypothetical protein